MKSKAIYIVVSGDNIYGPFVSPVAAFKWIENNVWSGKAYVKRLQQP